MVNPLGILDLAPIPHISHLNIKDAGQHIIFRDFGHLSIKDAGTTYHFDS